MKVQRYSDDLFLNVTMHMTPPEARILLSLLWKAYSDSDLTDKTIGDMHNQLFKALNANGELAPLADDADSQNHVVT